MYQFDQELSALVFPMISKIEVALRVRLVEALLIHNRYRKFIFYLGVKLSVLIEKRKFGKIITENVFDKLIHNNSGVVSLAAMNLPADWKEHLSV